LPAAKPVHLTSEAGRQMLADYERAFGPNELPPRTDPLRQVYQHTHASGRVVRVTIEHTPGNGCAAYVTSY
jgi:hypothetical protein